MKFTRTRDVRDPLDYEYYALKTVYEIRIFTNRHRLRRHYRQPCPFFG